MTVKSTSRSRGLWDGGFEFAFVSYMDSAKAEEWRTCRRASDLADAIHNAAIEEYPDYSKIYGQIR